MASPETKVQVKIEIGHKATLRKKSAIAVDGCTHDWTVFVRGPEGMNIMHFVDKVVFYLHDTFPKPKRVKKDPPYEVSESGYGSFIIPIEVFFKTKENVRRINFDYDLFLHLEGSPPVNHVRCEKLTFNNPSEEFKTRLLKGGGEVMVNGEPVSESGSHTISAQDPPNPAFMDLFENTSETKHKPKKSASSSKSSKPRSAPSSQKEKDPSSQSSAKSHKSSKPTAERIKIPEKEKPAEKEKHPEKEREKEKEKPVKEKPVEQSKSSEKPKEKEKEKSHSSSSGSKKKHKDKDKDRDYKPTSHSSSSTHKDSKHSSHHKSSSRDKDKEKEKEKEKDKSKSSSSTSNSSKSKSSSSASKSSSSKSSSSLSKDKEKEKSSKSSSSSSSKSKSHSSKSSTSSSSKKESSKSSIKLTPPPKELPPPPPVDNAIFSTGENSDEDLFGDAKSEASSSRSFPSPVKKEAVEPPSAPVVHDASKSKPLSQLFELMDSESEQDELLSPLSGDRMSPPPFHHLKSKSSPPREPSPPPQRHPTPPPPPPPAQTLKRSASPSPVYADMSARKRSRKPDVVPDHDHGHVHESESPQIGAQHSEEELNELLGLQNKLMQVTDAKVLQEVIYLIEETGKYNVGSETFNFDLCTLPPPTLKQIQSCLQAV